MQQKLSPGPWNRPSALALVAVKCLPLIQVGPTEYTRIQSAPFLASYYLEALSMRSNETGVAIQPFAISFCHLSLLALRTLPKADLRVLNPIKPPPLTT